ncbi:MAG: insulinase family protein [Clostridia bacterium]|nr:insulinase family protein [Clostridia bacterium]
MVYTKKYGNGLRVIVKEMPGLMSVTMGILVGTGAGDERDEEDGISHFIEHMQFKGTDKRTAFEVSDAFDRLGAQVNAYTGKDSTVYYAKSTCDHVEEAFEALSDLFLHATYPEDEMEREKGVVCEEISMNEDTPEDLCLDLLASAFYGKENYGRNILGPASNVQGFTKEGIKAYKKARYCPENVVVSFAGGIKKEQAFALVDEYFAEMEKGAFEKREKTIIQSSNVLVKKKPIEQTHIALAFPAYSRNHELADAMSAMSGVLGGNMSSRLFQEVREKRGLAYSVYSYSSALEECGSLTIYAGVNPKKANDALSAIYAVIDDLLKNGLTEEEFLRSREQMKSTLFFSNENTSSQMVLYGKYLLQRGEVFDFEEKLARINRMKRDDLLSALEFAFGSGKKSLAAVGNLDFLTL